MDDEGPTHDLSGNQTPPSDWASFIAKEEECRANLITLIVIMLGSPHASDPYDFFIAI
jgi:hypothetical protein